MHTTYIISGYGVPKDITKDDNMLVYLRVVLNTIYDAQTRDDEKKATLIVSGGPTDCFSPFRRTEATEILKVVQKFFARPTVKSVFRRISIATDTRSRSSLESLLNCKKVLTKQGLRSGKVMIFAETTRAARKRTIARKVFGKAFTVQVIPVDFDGSMNRYTDTTFRLKKEKDHVRLELWALQDPKHFTRYKKLFAGRLQLLRKANPNHHAAAVHAWDKKFDALLASI